MMPMELGSWPVAGAICGAQLLAAGYLARGRSDGQRRWLIRLCAVWLTAGVVGAGSLILSRELSRLSAAAVAQGLGAFPWALWMLAPAEEALKVVFVGPLYSHSAQADAKRGSALSASVGLALSAGHALGMGALAAPSAIEVVRVAASSTGHVLAPAAWGALLLGGRQRRWLVPTWLLASGLRGVLDEVALRQGPGLLVLCAPLILTLGWVCYVVVQRSLAMQGARETEGAASSGWHTPEALSGPLSEALEPGRKRLRWRWVGASVLVSAGLGSCAAAAGIALGRLWGIGSDGAADADLRSNASLLVLGACLAGSFPMSGFLLQKASPDSSPLEPAVGASLAVVGAAALMGSSPVVALVALMTTPLAFGLTLTGAWFGTRR